MSEPTPEEELMIRDQLDELLDASAPPPATIRSVDTRAMLAEARTVREAAGGGGRRAAVLSGALGLLLVGGAGIRDRVVRTGSGGQGWRIPTEATRTPRPPGENARSATAVGIPTNPVTQLQVNRIIDEWFANTDVEVAAEPYVAEQLAAVEADLAASEETARIRGSLT